MNTLSEYEVELLDFVMQYGYREEDYEGRDIPLAQELQPEEVAQRLIDYTTGRPTNEEVDMSRSFPQFVQTVEEMIDADHELFAGHTEPILILSDDAVAMMDRIAQEANDRDRELGFAIRGVWLSREGGNKHYLIGGFIAPAMDFANAERTTTHMDPARGLENSRGLSRAVHLNDYFQLKTGSEIGDLVSTAHIHQEALGAHWHIQPSQQDYNQSEQTVVEKGHPSSWAVVTKAQGQVSMLAKYSHLDSNGEVQHDDIPVVTESQINASLNQEDLPDAA